MVGTHRSNKSPNPNCTGVSVPKLAKISKIQLL